jgi:aspartate aminotransferase
MTVGVSEALQNSMLALIDPGDEVIIPEPCFVAYGPSVVFAGGVPVYVPTSVEDNFQVTRAAIEAAITPRTKAILIGYPNNPTGAVMTRERMLDIAALAEQYDLLVFSDEIYDRLVYGVEHICFAALPGMRERTILLGGFSKAYAMTGWRLGYAAGPAPLIAAINKLQSQISSCPSSVSQAAAAAALTGSQRFVQESLETYRGRRDAAVAALNAVDGLSCTTPEGAFYAYVNCAGVIGKTTTEGQVIATDEDFTLYLLEAASVAVIQGSAYGLGPYFRISYATSVDVIDESIAAIDKAVRALN